MQMLHLSEDERVTGWLRSFDAGQAGRDGAHDRSGRGGYAAADVDKVRAFFLSRKY